MLRLERRPKKALREAQGLISVGIKAMNAEQARDNVLETARQDIEHGDLAHADFTLPTPQGLENVGAAAKKPSQCCTLFLHGHVLQGPEIF
ncbi:hypothetical protein FIBSPDRAFT_304909 [Athelia psychrophila]|uniref:Uncharacterized protein n=1 Tax=Athelia psychrophila TaxID=1759441 RepID=A0A167WZ73_9AGAM|nr:hypothetical protein FIBSPDRAFT_304909 [Fibularhizoctonia sp. CBS 109695]